MSGSGSKSTFMKLFQAVCVDEKRKRYRKKERASTDEKPLNLGVAKQKLEQNINFAQVLPESMTAEIFCNQKEGEEISRKLVRFLRHDLASSGLRYTGDGAVLLQDVLQHWRQTGFDCTEEKVIEACKPKYGKGKTRIVVGEVENHGQFLCAVGGHTFDVPNPFGSYQMSLLDGKIMSMAYHATPSIELIKTAGFISQMTRNGVHLFYSPPSGKAHSYARRSTILRVDLLAAMNGGIVFKHNRFSDIVFGMGQWCPETQSFDGKIPLKYCSF